MYPVMGVDTLGADHEKVTSLSLDTAWKSSSPSGKIKKTTLQFRAYITYTNECCVITQLTLAGI